MEQQLAAGLREWQAKVGDHEVHAMQPILISAPGRSGTTLMMRILDGCKDIVLARSPPYEVRLLAYYAYAHRVLTAPHDFERSTHPDRLRGGGFFIGFNPYSHPTFASAFKDPSARAAIERISSDAIAGAFRAAITAWYATLAHQYDRPAAPLFAEKNDNLSREVVSFVDGTYSRARHIYLVRDPRDRYCSHRGYFKQNAESAIPDVIRSAKRQLDDWNETNPANRLILRYEDIANRELAALTRLSAFLGVEIPTLEVEFMQGHSTAGSVDRSIGRWRTDLGAEERAALLPELAPAIAAFGYPPE